MSEDKMMCLSVTCIYKATCAKHLDNIPIDDDDVPYTMVWSDTEKHTCYVSVDGQKVL